MSSELPPLVVIALATTSSRPCIRFWMAMPRWALVDLHCLIEQKDSSSSLALTCRRSLKPRGATTTRIGASQ